MGVDIAERKKTITWLKNRQDENGGFHYGDNKPVSFVGSYHAIAALYILGSLPQNVEQCKKWLSDHQTSDGGFGNSLKSPSLTTDEGFVVLQASYMLEKKLNPYWAEIIT
ncbi:prenyltransferase/squalene oxidase repeat-containing protein [Liquorilactobacillus satsumensis]|uniref:prenyltransferase/squalene oxidase repeat-containing protein n=1 Tax=Liquorilactobacillus satsumensis TaxID=259059 RepID=UPI0039EA614A